MRVALSFAILLLSVAPATAQAQDLDDASSAALNKTQSALKDPNQRKDLLKGDPGAKKVDSQVRKMAGSEQTTDDIYSLAADILGDLGKETKGDPTQMMELIEKAKKDPAAFAGKLSPAQLEKLKQISNQIQTPGQAKP